MKVFILTLLVLSSLCFVLGDEERKDEFIDLDTVDEGPVLKNDEQVEDYVEDAGQSVSLNDHLLRDLIHPNEKLKPSCTVTMMTVCDFRRKK